MNHALTTPPITNGTMFFNKYQLIRRIGSGAFGEVWLAKDKAVKHEFAIKILNDGIGIDERLLEAQIGHNLTHNNLVRVHQADVAMDKKVIIAMDYFPEGAITTLANPKGYLPLPTALRTVIDVLQGLEHLHQNNFFHNDVKPQNILRGPQGQAKLADYGIVGVSANGAPVQPSSWYKLHAAPETVSGRGIEARTDIFQTGLTLLRLLIGLNTLETKLSTIGSDKSYTDALAKGSLITRADFPPFIPNAVCRAVMRSIDPDPSKRFQSALEMRRSLEKLTFPGYWTVNQIGEMHGEDNYYTYRFTFISSTQSKASLTAFKTNKASGSEKRISQFTVNNLKKSQAKKILNRFIKSVVEGN